jgi:hypothetical protein
MGYIPAFLVLFSGGFLWGIVVYNSLKARLNILIHKLEKIKLLVNERNTAIQAILNEAHPSELGNFVDDPFLIVQAIQYSTDTYFLQGEGKAKLWLSGFLELLRDHNYNAESITFLQHKISDVNKELVEYARFGKQYNSIIDSKPTSFMASLLRFKKISL